MKTLLDEGYCEATFDAVLCWPETPPNTTVKLPCPLLGDYDFSNDAGYAYRLCQANGSWNRLANYRGCIPTDDYGASEIIHLQGGYGTRLSDLHIRAMYSIYWIGYVVSLFSCLFALGIFVHYKNLWCVRNIIHCNAILCFALHNAVWISYSFFKYEFHLLIDSPILGCAIPLTLLKYFICAAFFWMFVEGMYIFINVLFTYHAHKIRFWMCFAIGWGKCLAFYRFKSEILRNYFLWTNAFVYSPFSQYALSNPFLLFTASLTKRCSMGECIKLQ
uniref:G_PROTEIN_RECEP_F2_4 domain-containing protein n=1 Tax=Ascaris lumbricoides TaxID=6252 RepID=A0A0M3HVR9_ASCLU